MLRNGSWCLTAGLIVTNVIKTGKSHENIPNNSWGLIQLFILGEAGDDPWALICQPMPQPGLPQAGSHCFQQSCFVVRSQELVERESSSKCSNPRHDSFQLFQLTMSQSYQPWPFLTLYNLEQLSASESQDEYHQPKCEESPIQNDLRTHRGPQLSLEHPEATATVKRFVQAMVICFV